MVEGLRSNLETEVDLSSPEVENENHANRQPDLFTPANRTDGPKNLFVGRFLFQRLLILSAIQLLIYLNKLYHDCDAVKTYFSAHETNFFILSVTALVIPPLIYSLFLIGDNLINDDIIDKKAVTTNSINGLLLIPWQIKRHLDVLHYVAAKICVFRAPNDTEREDISAIKRKADILEFFEDFYAGFLHLIFQLYILWNNYSSNYTKMNGLMLYGQLFASALSILSLMSAVRRRDDGILTSFLSFTGWLSLYVSRIVLFVLIATDFGAAYLTTLCLLHSIAMSAWIYSIAIESYRTNSDTNHANHWTIRKSISLALMVFLLLGIPSLLMWPIMFQLKEHCRPLKYLLIIAAENFSLIALWLAPKYFIEQLEWTHEHVLIAIGVSFATVMSFIFLGLYIGCKPRFTDEVVLHNMSECCAQSYGINFEFCKLVFKLPTSESFGQSLRCARNLDARLFQRM